MQGGSEDVKPNQERRLKSTQGDDQQQHQPQQPQKCPRCESLNTKFCYYNNYNLSQPRYFCKTCRRYWTLGGTLRNVPVGGGCRKGKRAKTSSSSSSGENSRLQQQLPQQPHLLQHNFATPQNILATNNSGNLSSLALRNKEPGNLVSPPPGMSTMASYFPGGGFLTSLEAIHPLNNNQPPIQSFPLQPLNQPLNLGGVLGETSNLGLLHGFNAVPAFGSQNQQQSQLYHVGYRDTRSIEHSFYPHNQESSIQSSRPATSSHQQQNWHHGFMSNSNHTVSDTALWSTSTSTTIGHTNSNINPTAGSSPLNPDQWKHGLSGYGPPS